MGHAFEDTHPHITFGLDLRRASPELWILLGEAVSKASHVARALLAPKESRDLMHVYLAKGIHATTAIEGNTLSEEEVRQAVEHKLRVAPSKEYMATEVENVLGAMNELTSTLASGSLPAITTEFVKGLNRSVLEGLDLPSDVVPGEIRGHSVLVGGAYRGAPARDCEHLLERLCGWLSGDDFGPPDPVYAGPLAVIKAIVAHLYIAWIHPFGDGNGRVARLVEHTVLLEAGFPLPTTQLLSNHYNATRAEYYRALDRARAEGPLAFVMYAVRGFVDGVREQLRIVWLRQSEDRFEQYVYERIGRIKGDMEQRRIWLALDLARTSEAPVAKRDLPDLSPRLARAYATKTEKTLTRDLNALKELELVREAPRGQFEANREILLAFLPLRHRGGVLDAWP